MPRRYVEADDTGRTTTRVQLEMPPQAMVRLQKMKDHTEAASYAEVIRNALRLFEALVDEHERGSDFFLKRADGEIIRYKIFVWSASTGRRQIRMIARARPSTCWCCITPACKRVRRRWNGCAIRPPRYL